MALPTTTSNSATQQGNYQSNQNFDVDVVTMYKHFVTGGATPNDNEAGQNVGIDDLRGQISVSVTSQTTADLIKALNISPTAPPAPTPTTSTPVSKVQESRCHAFYRIIGFPVVSADKQTFYNPGFDSLKVNQDGSARTITLDIKIGIASKVDPGFESVSQAREQYAAGTAQIFSVPESVEAGVLALTSGTYGKNGNPNLRKFAQPFLKNESTDPFDFLVDDQSYSIPGDITSMYSLVGNSEVLLSDYQSVSGDPNNTPTPYGPNPSLGNTGVLSGHEHIIVPFMVDPRIDFSIWGSESSTSSGLSKRIAIPFVPNASYLKVSSTATAERPLLEKVIRDRFSAFNTTSDIGTSNSNTISYVKSSKTIAITNVGNVSLGGLFSGDVFKVSQQASLNTFLQTIYSMMDKLADAMIGIHSAQSAFYWLPVPDASGPEGGCTVRDVPLSSNINNSLITPFDLSIIFNQAQVIVSSITTSIGIPTATPDPGSYAFSGQDLTFDSNSSDSAGDQSSQTKDTLATKRNKTLSRSSEALQVVEMIMGEFSGLGLADIVVIRSALYIMPFGNLLGFLDNDAIVRAEQVLGAPTMSLQNMRPDIDTTMKSFAQTVNTLYQIMDSVFHDTFNHNALNLT